MSPEEAVLGVLRSHAKDVVIAHAQPFVMVLSKLITTAHRVLNFDGDDNWPTVLPSLKSQQKHLKTAGAAIQKMLTDQPLVFDSLTVSIVDIDEAIHVGALPAACDITNALGMLLDYETEHGVLQADADTASIKLKSQRVDLFGQLLGQFDSALSDARQSLNKHCPVTHASHGRVTEIIDRLAKYADVTTALPLRTSKNQSHVSVVVLSVFHVFVICFRCICFLCISAVYDSDSGYC